jgi:hypothetical protein
MAKTLVENKVRTALVCQHINHPFFTSTLQPRLTINQPDDVYEREADAMADKVMRMPDHEDMTQPFFRPRISSLQRKCAHCEEEEKNMQRKELNNEIATPADGMEGYVKQLNNGGQSLSKQTRSFFEPRFGHDFSEVKVHTDPVAAKSAQSINALAYTSGSHIVFNDRQYSPGSTSGKKLLAHELTHVVQQNSFIQPKQIQRARLSCTTRTNIDVYLVSLPGSTRDTTADVDFANTVLCQCGIQLNVVGGESWATSLLDLLPPNGVLNESTSHNVELDTMLNYQPGGPDVLHVYFVPRNTYGDRGGSYGYTGVLTGVPLSVSVTNSGVTDTLAHEMTHIFLQDGAHHASPDNLLASGASRRIGVDELTADQCSNMP